MQPSHRRVIVAAALVSILAGIVWYGIDHGDIPPSALRLLPHRQSAGGLSSAELEYLRFLAHFEKNRRDLERLQLADMLYGETVPDAGDARGRAQRPSFINGSSIAQYGPVAHDWREMYQRFKQTPAPSRCKSIMIPYAQALDQTAHSWEAKAAAVTASARRAQKGKKVSGATKSEPETPPKAIVTLYADANRALDDFRAEKGSGDLPPEVAALRFGP
jgi:hypothetical protein